MNSRTAFLVFMILILIMFCASSSFAQVHVVRGGEENPVITIGKSTLYGAGTGLLLGLALTLVVEEDTGDVIKWSFVGGTLGGFLVGIYHVASRPGSGSALINFEQDGLAKVRFPEPRLRLLGSRQMELRMNLVSVAL